MLSVHDLVRLVSGGQPPTPLQKLALRQNSDIRRVHGIIANLGWLQRHEFTSPVVAQQISTLLKHLDRNLITMKAAQRFDREVVRANQLAESHAKEVAKD